MKISLLSQNLGNNDVYEINPIIPAKTLTANPRVNNANKLPTVIDPDIHVEFTQEDKRPLDVMEPLIPIQTSSGTSYIMIGTESLNKKAVKGNVITKVYVRSDNRNLFVHGRGQLDIKMEKGIIKGPLANIIGAFKPVTKGATWIKVTNTDTNESYLFVNMHLPIDTGKWAIGEKNRTLGNMYRIESFKRIVSRIHEIYGMDPNLKIIMGGDLNFRNIDDQDQLTALLKDKNFTNNIPYTLSELSKDKGATCKYLTTCSFNRTGKQDCLDTKRAPSRCDRFLTNARNIKDNMVFKNFVLDPIYDHNAVYLSFEETKEITKRPKIVTNGLPFNSYQAPPISPDTPPISPHTPLNSNTPLNSPRTPGGRRRTLRKNSKKRRSLRKAYLKRRTLKKAYH